MNRNFAIGCGGVIAVLVIFGGVLILETPKFLEKGKAMVGQAIADEMRIAAMENAWQPPSAAVDGEWFPSTVGEWKLERSEPRTGIPELNIDRAGYHATYRTGAGSIEVDVIAATDLEKATLISRASDTLGNRRLTGSTNGGGVQVGINSSSSRTTTTRANRTHVKIGGEDHTRFWWVKGTLFIFRARGGADSAVFPEEYLRTISPTTPPAEPKLERP